MVKMGHDTKAIALAKYSVWVKRLKIAKWWEEWLHDHIRVTVWKTRSKNDLILEKREHFEIGQNWPRRKGYSFCKMISVGQKLKVPKRCEKRLYDHIRADVCKKLLQKHLRFEKWEHYKNGQTSTWRKGYKLSKMVRLGQKLKIPRRCEKRLYDLIRVVFCKNAFRKTRNIPKVRAILKWRQMATTQRL